MLCTNCKEPIQSNQPYCRTKKGPHHFRCFLKGGKRALTNQDITDIVEHSLPPALDEVAKTRILDSVFKILNEELGMDI